MSGAPTGTYFTVTKNGEDKRYYIGTNVLSDRTMERLRAQLVTRRRDKRRELLRDVSELRDLPRSAMESFMAKLLEEARQDLEVTPEQAFNLLTTMDREALGTLLLCAVEEIKTLEEALDVIQALVICQHYWK